MLIGRGEDCDLRPRTGLISRHHCVINVTDSQVLVKDLGSKNGTYVNGNRIETEQGLQASDTVSIGPLKFEVLIEHGSPKRPEVKDLADVVQRTAQDSTNDFDISSWLEEVDEEERDQRFKDPATRQFKVEETNSLSVPEGSVEKLDEVPAENISKAEVKKKNKKKKEFGKLPQAAKLPQQHKSSQDAAQDMLKKLFSKG